MVSLLFFEGVMEIAIVFLSVVSGLIALSIFEISRKTKELQPWRFLVAALILFAVSEIISALRSFGVYSSPYLTHVLASVILILLALALIYQIQITKTS